MNGQWLRDNGERGQPMIPKPVLLLPGNGVPSSLLGSFIRLNDLSLMFSLTSRAALDAGFVHLFLQDQCHRALGRWGPDLCDLFRN